MKEEELLECLQDCDTDLEEESQATYRWKVLITDAVRLLLQDRIAQLEASISITNQTEGGVG